MNMMNVSVPCFSSKWFRTSISVPFSISTLRHGMVVQRGGVCAAVVEVDVADPRTRFAARLCLQRHGNIGLVELGIRVVENSFSNVVVLPPTIIN